MKLKNLIKHLQKLEAEHGGDTIVMLSSSGDELRLPKDSVYYNAEWETAAGKVSPKIVIDIEI